ncbi:unnamed protein product [Brassica napus]|uniref:(rape) hypothetical protein n=1 Tax=Brassica napus TaxID=3708 RepID=A0A816UBT4_BRANA|nr:unnamed protein product [Brassica napus]
MSGTVFLMPQSLVGGLKVSDSKLSETVDALQPKDDEDCGRVTKTTLKDGVGNEASKLATSQS